MAEVQDTGVTKILIAGYKMGRIPVITQEFPLFQWFYSPMALDVIEFRREKKEKKKAANAKRDLKSSEFVETQKRKILAFLVTPLQYVVAIPLSDELLKKEYIDLKSLTTQSLAYPERGIEKAIAQIPMDGITVQMPPGIRNRLSQSGAVGSQVTLLSFEYIVPLTQTKTILHQTILYSYKQNKLITNSYIDPSTGLIDLCLEWKTRDPTWRQELFLGDKDIPLQLAISGQGRKYYITYERSEDNKEESLYEELGMQFQLKFEYSKGEFIGKEAFKRFEEVFDAHLPIEMGNHQMANFARAIMISFSDACYRSEPMSDPYSLLHQLGKQEYTQEVIDIHKSLPD